MAVGTAMEAAHQASGQCLWRFAPHRGQHTTQIVLLLAPRELHLSESVSRATPGGLTGTGTVWVANSLGLISDVCCRSSA